MSLPLYDGSREYCLKSFLVTSKVFSQTLQEQFPTTAMRFPAGNRLETIYDFLSMQSENPSCHPEILKRNVYVAAKKKWSDLKEDDFLVTMNMFLIIYITNCHTISSEIENRLVLDAEVLTLEGLINIIDQMSPIMMKVVSEGFGRDYTPMDLQTKLINYERAWRNVVNR